MSSTASHDAVIVLTTLSAAADAETFARTLVDERLAACVNVLPPMVSVYRWNGGIERDAERQLVIKTTGARLGALQARIKALHPYAVPEFLVIALADGSPEYLSWLHESCS